MNKTEQILGINVLKIITMTKSTKLDKLKDFYVNSPLFQMSPYC